MHLYLRFIRSSFLFEEIIICNFFLILGENSLRIYKYGYNEELAKLHFLGGGAMLMKHFAKLDQSKVRFIEDIHANAKGYEYLSNQRLLRSIRCG